MSAAPSIPPTVKELIRSSLQASKEHQYALKVYTERLEAELEAVDRLLTAAEAPDDDQDVDVGGHVVILGALKAISPIPSEIAPGEHPFVDDVAKRQKYMQHTTIHPMKAADFEALADAVRSENHRLHALAAQKRGQQPFVGLNDHPQSHFEKNKQDINWERVAQKVTAATSNPVKRSAEECEIRWLGERHPDFDRSQWPPSEILKVKQLVGSAKECEIDWADIATKLGTRRTPLDCMRHAIPRKMHVWTQESDQRLIEMVKVYGTENWQLTRQISEDATATQCQNRYTRSLDPQLRRGPWAQEEDEQLRRAVEIFGRSWVDVSAFIPTRSNEQCRDRWQDVLNPSISKGKWSESEDQILRSACEELGEKWKEISQRVGGGRTDNMASLQSPPETKTKEECYGHDIKGDLYSYLRSRHGTSSSVACPNADSVDPLFRDICDTGSSKGEAKTSSAHKTCRNTA
ncbi:hypothetical protein PHLGIDRAFT_116589 [Phlebiopsis gigantea 11061_1 CR5-6]|uniref:Uncharacterized protein n=1 Tax=Phlebiopsis gigantea (strain 11061_1 CR5-6) TaxID=745531 RepID=A0A0C3SCW6_PHLG1|nr:hypothetical protein PHLGIDRAFT_116589 [Phlebiopsis gigantea 11061_1 CR5-6]